MPNTLDHEVWIGVVGYEGRYSVSNLGNVRRENHTIVRRDGVPQSYSQRPMLPVIREDGRYDVVIGGRRQRIAHLVARAFLGPRPNGYVVSHKDGNKTNDRLTNLAYMSKSQNQTNVADGLHKHNTSGYRGITFSKGQNIWRGVVVVEGKRYGKSSVNKEVVIAWRKHMEQKYRLDQRIA